MDQFIEDEGKLGHGFTSADELEKIDHGDGSKPRLTYISAKLDANTRKNRLHCKKVQGLFCLGIL
jgi:hypothetical protein